MRTNLFYIALYIALFFVDQILKNVITAIVPPETVHTIFPFFAVTNILNKDMAFGVVFSFPFLLFFYIVVVMFISVGLFLMWRTYRNVLFRSSVICILAGGMSNIIDRMRFGGVRDVFSLQGITIFNIADTWILLGILCAAYSVVIIDKAKDKKAS